MNNKYLLLFECCRLVKGYTQSIICDLQRSKSFVIPNVFYDALLKLPLSRTDFVNHFDLKNRKDAETIVNKFIELEYLFETDNPMLFTKLNLEWEEPGYITNAIIELELLNDNNLKFIDLLQDVGCEHIELRLGIDFQISDLIKVMEFVKLKRILSINIFMFYQSSYEEKLFKLVYEYPRINNIYCHNANENKIIFISDTGMGNIYKLEKVISNNACGNISKINFVNNIKFYTESLHHNSCLNRKISIDADGNIKNCPSMSESFGNIKDTTLIEALEKPGFRKYWNISKDQIEVCRDCEFRYICTDCRAYVDDPNDTSGPEGTNLSKPLKCGYNPYSGEWNEWSSSTIKQKAISYYNISIND